MITWILTVVSLIGNYLNCKKIIICFYLWILCNLGWLAIDILGGVYSRAVLDGVQIGFSAFGIFEWKKKS